MAKPFDPRKVLKHIANSLLREFFTRRGELGNVPWDELSEHKIEPIFEACQQLPEMAQLEIQVLLRDIHELADHRGVAALVELIRLRCPDRGEEFEAQLGEADKAMWAYHRVHAVRAGERLLQALDIVEITLDDLRTLALQLLRTVLVRIARDRPACEAAALIGQDCPAQPATLRAGRAQYCDDFPVSHVVALRSEVKGKEIRQF